MKRDRHILQKYLDNDLSEKELARFEQELNARYLSKLGYGSWTPSLEPDVIQRFLARLDRHERALAGYESVDNTMTLACVDELLDCVAADISRPRRLQTVARGAWEG